MTTYSIEISDLDTKRAFIQFALDRGFDRLSASGSTDEVRIKMGHLALFKALDQALEHRPDPASLYLTPWDFELPEAAGRCAAQLVRNELAQDGGDAGDDEDVRLAICSVKYAMQALGLPAGDWMHFPILAAFRRYPTRPIFE